MAQGWSIIWLLQTLLQKSGSKANLLGSRIGDGMQAYRLEWSKRGAIGPSMPISDGSSCKRCPILMSMALGGVILPVRAFTLCEQPAVVALLPELQPLAIPIITDLKLKGSTPSPIISLYNKISGGLGLLIKTLAPTSSIN